MQNQSPIIPVSDMACHRPHWKSELKAAFRRGNDLLQYLELKPSDLTDIDVEPDFPMLVPRAYARKMRKGDPEDPLLLQVLARRIEHAEVDGFVADPLQELNHTNSGLLHKYRGRVLLMLTAGCAVNCRYCFRRHFPYQNYSATGERLEQALRYITEQPDIQEVIFSGGDPLMVDDDRIIEILGKIEGIDHIKRVRFHTRLPVVIAQRLTEKLGQRLSVSPLKITLVLHINHANEIDQELAVRLQNWYRLGIRLFNQSVLLRNINDSCDRLVALSEALDAVDVIPYYLHQLDKVAGAAHFAVNDDAALRLHREMQKWLPGYLVPRLVREVPGKASKTWL